MKLIKVNRILKFKPSEWLKKIDFNLCKRKNAANNFLKIFFKPRNHSSCGKTIVYGKTIKN